MKLVAIILLLSLPMLAQDGIVAEAQKKIDKQKHERLVEKAKNLLEKQKDLEAQLARIKTKLEKLDQGIDVEPEKDDTAIYLTGSTGSSGCCTLTSCGTCR